MSAKLGSRKILINVYAENEAKIVSIPHNRKAQVINKVLELYWEQAIAHPSLAGILDLAAKQDLRPKHIK